MDSQGERRVGGGVRVKDSFLQIFLNSTSSELVQK